MTDASQVTHGAKNPADWLEPDGTVWHKLNELGNRASAFHAIDTAGELAFTGTAVTVPVVEHTDTGSQFTLSGGTATSGDAVGTYIVTYSVTVGVLAGADRAEASAYLDLNSSEHTASRGYASISAASGATIRRGTTTITSNTTLDATYDVVLVDASSGAITVTLPTAASVTGMYVIKKIDSSANAVTIAPNGVETIDDSLTKVITTQYDSVTIVSDGTEHWIE